MTCHVDHDRCRRRAPHPHHLADAAIVAVIAVPLVLAGVALLYRLAPGLFA